MLLGQPQENIDINQYANGKLSVYLSTKKKFIDRQGKEFVFFMMAKIPVTSLTAIFNDLGTMNSKELNNICASYTTDLSTIHAINQQEVHITPRQAECLFYLLRGKSYKEIAYTLGLSVRTVEDHISLLKDALGCYSKGSNFR